MSVLSKPYVITDAGRQSEDIDRMFDDVYTEIAELERANAERLSGAGGAGGGARGLPGNDGDDADAQWPILVTDTDIARLRLANAFLATNTFAGLSQFNGECSFTSEPITFAGVITTSQGMRLPSVQVVSANPNTLDDYEEGTWTPVFGGSGTTSGQVYTTQIGRYVKIGKIVHVTGRVQLSTKGTITGDIQIKALPFTLVNITGYFPVGPIGGWSLATAYVFVCSELATNTTDATLLAATAAATSLSVLATANLNDTSALDFMFTYEAAA